MYHHFKEIDWMPSVDQVLGTLPAAFKEKFPTTYALIDRSERFIEMPSDLHMQSTWSQYKHHNTVKSWLHVPQMEQFVTYRLFALVRYRT